MPPPLGFVNWDPIFKDTFSYTKDQNESSHKAFTSIHDSMYSLHLQMGIPQDVTHQVVTPEAFHTHIAWPGVRSFSHKETYIVGVVNEEDGNE